MIVVQHRLSQDPTDINTKAENDRLLSHYEHHFSGSLPKSVELVWNCGFISKARLALTYDDFQNEAASADNALPTLLSLPTAQIMTELVLGMTNFDGEPGYDGVIPILCGAEDRPPLRSLYLGDFEYPDESEMSWFIVGDVSDIWFGDSNYGAEGDIADIRPILAGTGIGEVVHLGLRNAEFTDEICQEIVGAPILRRLVVLDLSMGTMSTEGAQVLVYITTTAWLLPLLFANM
ncbi:MAG: hypothetical protein HN348_11310 [Proteobacteria bacterium]|nr:hypothetical protein [Pseudomonadota bacterium]